MSTDLARDPMAAFRGAVAAFTVGALVACVDGPTDVVRALLAEPTLVVLSLGIAVVIGAGLAGRVIRASRGGSIAIALVYGIAVPAFVAGLVALPVAPIAVAVSVTAWPVSVPSALGWLGLLRWPRSRARLGNVRSATVVVVLAGVLLTARYTQPRFSSSPAGNWCVGFPGEVIESLAWSPDGDWLGVASERNDMDGIVRVIELGSKRIVEIARDPYLDALGAGIAVGPGGETTYIVDKQGASVPSGAHDTAIWAASPSGPSHRVAELPTPAVAGLTWTPAGIAAVLWVDPSTWTEIHQLVWVRPEGAGADRILEPIDPATIVGYPILAPLVDPDPDADMVIRTPSGDRMVAVPSDISGDVSVSSDGAFLVFQARALTADGMDLLYDHLVAESTETGERIVLVEEETWAARLAPGRLAYLTDPLIDGNSVCVQDVAKT